jgi:MFS family permease
MTEEGERRHLAMTSFANRWLLQLLAASTITHAVIFAARPMTTYRALELEATGFQIGLLASSFAIVPLLFAVPIGRGVDGTRAHFFLRAGAVTQALGALGLWQSSGLVGLALSNVVLGLGMLATIVAVQGLLARRASERQHDRVFGWFTVAVSAGQFIGPPVAVYAADVWQPGGPSSGLFSAVVLAALGVLLVLRVASHADDRVDQQQRESRDGVWVILSRRGMPAAMVASLALLVAVDLLTIFLPFFGEEKGIPPSTIGWLLAARAFASLISRLMVARLSALVGRRRLLLLSMVSTAATFAALPFATSAVPLLFLMLLAGFVLGLGQPLTMSLVAGLVEPHSRATALGLRIGANRLGQVLLPGAAGLLASAAGAGGVFLFLAVMVGAASVSATERLADRGEVTSRGRTSGKQG